MSVQIEVGQKPKTARRNIPVYKVLKYDDTGVGGYEYYKYARGAINKPIEEPRPGEVREFTDHNGIERHCIELEQGYIYAYSKKKDAENLRQYLEDRAYYIDIKRPYYKTVTMYIPYGTEYYESIFNDLDSEIAARELYWPPEKKTKVNYV